MHAGQHGEFLWEIANGELVISSTNANIGVLMRQPINNRFNNDEQATWFAQGKIDTQLEALSELLSSRDSR